MTKLREKHGDLEFVLAGDIFDFWRDYAKNCIPISRELFKGMADLTKKESDITYVIGNHDHFLKLRLFGKPLYGKTNLKDVEPGKSDAVKSLKALGVDFDAVYPDLNIKRGNKLICITHGHFLTEEMGIDDWFIRAYLIWARILHFVTPKREDLEKRKIKTYDTVFKRMVKTFDTKEKKKTFTAAPKEMQQKNYDNWKAKKLRNNFQIMNMKRKRWKLPCHLYVSGHTHIPGMRNATDKYPIPYLNSGVIHGNRANYLVLFDKKAELRNVGKEKVCSDFDLKKI